MTLDPDNLKRLAQAVLIRPVHAQTRKRRMSEFRDATTPDVVLELVAERENLRGLCQAQCDENERILAETERLAGEYKRVQAERDALRERVATLERRDEFSQEWWGGRMERLRKLAKEHGLLTEFCNIAANGTAHVTEPHQPLWSQLRERVAELEAELSRARDLREPYSYLAGFESASRALTMAAEKAVPSFPADHVPVIRLVTEWLTGSLGEVAVSLRERIERGDHVAERCEVGEDGKT